MTDRDRLTEHVLQGLTRPQKALSSAWFYDDEGSRLFQQIMALPEYYLTRLEHELLRSRADELSRWIDPRCSPIDLIELGSGDGAKRCRCARHWRNVKWIASTGLWMCPHTP
jgi:uncharacterized SAM-dependent methyltransferase